MMTAPTPGDHAAGGSPEQPRVWLVLGDKKGDNGQVLTIEEALGWRCEMRHIQVLDQFVFGKPKVGPTLYHIDRDKSDSLEPPWPDLIITVGRRPANVALWIREQSGGHTKIVLVGKPSGMLEKFSLIVISAESRIPPLSKVMRNVLPISLPLMRVDRQAVAAADEAWKARFDQLPRPLIGVMLGGPTGPYVFHRSVIEQLVEAAKEIRQQGGTPYFTTSRRTPPQVVAELERKLPPGCRLFAWSADSADNPYLGLLGGADGFIVTGDSISMMVEVVRLGKPLAILSLPTSLLGGIDQLRRSFARWLYAPVGDSLGDRLRILLVRLMYYSRLMTFIRDFRAFHQMLIDCGLAVPMGQGFSPPAGKVPDDAALVVARIKQLMGIG